MMFRIVDPLNISPPAEKVPVLIPPKTSSHPLFQMVSVPVHVHLESTPQGVMMGGVLEHILHEIVVRVKAEDIPHAINIDVEALNIGDSLHISDVDFPEGVTADIPDELVVATVVAPTVIAVEEPEEELEEGEEGAEAAEGEEAEEASETVESEESE